MLFIGDVHRNLDRYKKIAGSVDESLQVGDMGIFDEDDASWFESLGLDPSRHKFFRGNHDNPTLCQNQRAYLSDFGYIEAMDMMWLAGGFSIDYMLRTEGKSWWRNEQLPWRQLSEAINMAENESPSIMVSHECPESVIGYIHRESLKASHPSRTAAALDAILDVGKPDLWIFGHHHKKIEFDHQGCHFVGLGELQIDFTPNCIFEVRGLTWDR